MTDNHPITPPPNLVQEWYQEADDQPAPYYVYMAHQAARWGADQELLACGKYLEQCAAWEPEDVTELYNYRRPRPKPPSLKEQALAALNVIEDKMLGPTTEEKLIRRALEALPNE